MQLVITWCNTDDPFSLEQGATFRLFDKALESLTDEIDLLIGDLRIDGKREDLLGQRFRDGEITFLITQIAVSFLHMDRNRIMDSTEDLFICHLLHDFVTVTLFDLNDKKMVNMRGILSLNRKLDGRKPFEIILISFRSPVALLVPLSEILQLDIQDRRLHSVKAAIDAEFRVIIFLR